jgi:hypothetical protein
MPILSRDFHFGLPGFMDLITGRQLLISDLQFLGTSSLGGRLLPILSLPVGPGLGVTLRADPVTRES